METTNKNFPKRIRNWFLTKDPFTRTAIIILAVFLAVTPAIIAMKFVQPHAQTTAADVTVTVDVTKPSVVTNLLMGVTHEVDLQPNSDATALASAKQLNSSANPFQVVLMMGGGSGNPEPEPGQYNFTTLDQRVALMTDSGAKDTAMALWSSPTWMVDPNWSPGIYNGSDTDWSKQEMRPLDTHFDDFAALAGRVATRYKGKVHKYVVWAELKGFYNTSTNTWDYAKYTLFYNKVYDAVKAADPTAEVGGMYMNTQTRPGCVVPPTDPSLSYLVNQIWGSADQRQLDTISYWLANKHGADFFAEESYPTYGELYTTPCGTLTSGNNVVHPFDDTQLVTAFTRWIKSKTTLPIWWIDWYATPYTSETFDHYKQNAVEATMVIKMAEGGAIRASKWQPQGGNNSYEGERDSLWTDTLHATTAWPAPYDKGGQPYPYYYTQRDFTQYFPPGTQLYTVSVSQPSMVEAMASATKIMLVNKTSNMLTVAVNGSSLTLIPYQVLFTDVPQNPTITTTSQNTTNVLQNAGFETGNNSPWTTYGIVNNVSSGVVSSHANTGTYAMGVGSTTAEAGAEQQLVAIPGALYTLSGWLEVGAAGDTGFIGLKFKDASGADIPNTDKMAGVTSTAYQNVTTSETAPTNAASVVAYVYKATPSSNFIYGDDLTLTSEQITTTLTIPTTTSTPTPTPTPTNTPTPTASPTPVVYSISGSIYVDANKNGYKDSQDYVYTSSSVLVSGSGTKSESVYSSAGNYALLNLSSGLENVSITVPSGYQADTLNPVNSVSVGSDKIINFGIVPVQKQYRKKF